MVKFSHQLRYFYGYICCGTGFQNGHSSLK
jgi:hypothetical protein